VTSGAPLKVVVVLVTGVCGLPLKAAGRFKVSLLAPPSAEVEASPEPEGEEEEEEEEVRRVVVPPRGGRTVEMVEEGDPLRVGVR